uniref:Ig-like domain-containing protein n=1 Tax=Chrysemys picta bellii TaxID=8478 RepID=A0A8C3HUE1_CHRPI
DGPNRGGSCCLCLQDLKAGEVLEGGARCGEPSSFPPFSSPPGSHSLRYFYTGVSEPGAGLPSFLAVGYVDDVAFIHYDSETQTARPQPQAPWMEGKVEAQYWERETRNLRNVQARYKVSLQTLIQRYNRSGGESLHTYQNTYGCNLLANGSTWGIDQFAFDGNDFISFDKNTLTWVAADPGAQVTKRKWGDSDIQYRKRYQEQTCVEWLRKYLEHGKETLQRRERPAVRVTGRDAPGGPTTLSCRAHGFYPRDIALSWLRKGESSEQKTWRGGVLPNGDGTYHAWATVEIDPRERDLYSCRVEHESLAQPLDTAWEPPSHSAPLPVLIGAVAGAALLAGTVGFVLWRRRRSGNGGPAVPPLSVGRAMGPWGRQQSGGGPLR